MQHHFQLACFVACCSESCLDTVRTYVMPPPVEDLFAFLTKTLETGPAIGEDSGKNLLVLALVKSGVVTVGGLGIHGDNVLFKRVIDGVNVLVERSAIDAINNKLEKEVVITIKSKIAK